MTWTQPLVTGAGGHDDHPVDRGRHRPRRLLLARWLFQKPNAVVRVSGVPGTVLPKGFVVGFARGTDVLVSASTVTIGPCGHVVVPARKTKMKDW